MGMCKNCGKVFSVIEMTDGLCKTCLSPEVVELNQNKKEKIEDFEKNKFKILQSIIVTSETSIENVEKRIDFTSAQCVYGLNIIKDLFVGVRNIVGGRVKSIEDPLAEAKNTIIEALKKEAYFAGGNAVIGIKIEHTYNNAGAANMVSILGTGTIVKLKA